MVDASVIFNLWRIKSMIHKSSMTNVTIIEDGTGVVIPHDEYRAKVWDEIRPLVKAEAIEEIQHRHKATEKQRKALEGIENRTELQKLILKEYGHFFFAHYKEFLDLLGDEKGNFDSALACRFIYLSTYMDYDNNLKWGNEFRGKYTGYMTIKDLDEVMGLSRKQLWEFKNKIIELNLLSVGDGGVLSINKKYCRKGKLTANNKRDSIRCFEAGIQELYRTSTAKEHKRLGMLIQLLPYINYNHSVLSLNPEENEPRNIQPLTIQDICTLVGHNIKNARRLEKDLYKISVGGNYIMGKFLYYSAEAFIINPAVYYKGNNIEALQGVMNLFKLVNR